jgi:hypothetical protein
MLLLPYVALSLVGFAFFVLGAWLDYLGVAAVGAVIFIGVGATVAVGDLETQTGASVDRNVTTVAVNQNGTIINETVVDGVERTKQFETVAPLRRFGEGGPFALGAFQMVAGAVLLGRRLNEVQ